MAGYYVPLGRQQSGNALIDFSGINNGIDAISTANQQQVKNALAERNMKMQEDQFAYQRGRDQKADARSDVEWYGKQAMAVDQMQGPQRAAAWQRIIAKHGVDGLSPEEIDHTTGPKLLMAQAGQFIDPIERQTAQAKLNLLRAQTENAISDKNKFTVVGNDAMGQPQYGFVNPRTLEVKPFAHQAAAQPDQAKQSLTGDDYLATLPPQVATQVRSISEGRLPVPSGFALKSPYWQQMMQHVSQFDPNFDAINYGARAKTRNDFTSGKSAQNITSFNTAIGHIDTLDKSIDKLGNTNVPMMNRVRNMLRGQTDTKYQANLKEFSSAKQAVVDELTRAFRGTGGSVHDIKGWEETINAADSPAALHAATKQAVDLLNSRIESVADQYNRGMGTSKDPVELLSPKARDTLKRLNDGGSKSGPRPGDVVDGYRFRGGHPGDPNSWEKM